MQIPLLLGEGELSYQRILTHPHFKQNCLNQRFYFREIHEETSRQNTQL